MRLSVYQCPSDDRVTVSQDLRVYFGVAGGMLNSNDERSCVYGNVFTDGMFAMNKWRRFANISDGSSCTLAIGESSHNAFGGLNPDGGIESPPRYGDEGGYAPWWFGGTCPRNPPCSPVGQSIGRHIRSTFNPINLVIYPLESQYENEVPFGSRHSGGAHFVYADGHVGFLNDTINMNTYRNLSTIVGGEIIAGVEY